MHTDSLISPSFIPVSKWYNIISSMLVKKAKKKKKNHPSVFLLHLHCNFNFEYLFLPQWIAFWSQTLLPKTRLFLQKLLN